MRGFLIILVIACTFACTFACSEETRESPKLEAKALCQKGFAAMRDNEFDDAIASFRKALLMRPRYAGAQYGIASVFEETGEFGAALNAYDEAIEFNPEFALAYWARGALLNEVGEEGEGDDDLESAYQLDPKLKPIETGNLIMRTPTLKYEPWLH